MTITRKLNLSEFLAQENIVESPLVFQPKEQTNMSYSLLSFYKVMSEHVNTFTINNKIYTSIIPSSNNLYFFKESSNDEFMLLFDPIIDIKKKDDDTFVVFYYPDTVINISLRKSDNVK